MMGKVHQSSLNFGSNPKYVAVDHSQLQAWLVEACLTFNETELVFVLLIPFVFTFCIWSCFSICNCICIDIYICILSESVFCSCICVFL